MQVNQFTKDRPTNRSSRPCLLHSLEEKISKQPPKMRAIRPLVTLMVALHYAIVASAAQSPSTQPFQTAPMGWSTWYAFGPAINETRVLQTADALVSSGLSALGYKYVLIDDNWMAPQRDRYGNLYGDPHRFPSGMKNLADKVRSMGTWKTRRACASAQVETEERRKCQKSQ